MPKRHGLVITPLYRTIDGDGIDHEGSAVLIGTNGRWLFTAAHVIDAHDIIFLPGRPQVRIHKERFSVSPPSLDLAYMELKPSEANALINCGLKFLSLEKIDASTEPFPPDVYGCAISGYPVDSIEIDGDACTINAKPTIVTSQFLAPSELVHAKLDPQNQIAAKFGGLSIDPKGLSGGAIWRVKTEEATLVGIATDYDPKRKILIGTRVRPMLQEILRILVRGENGSA